MKLTDRLNLYFSSFRKIAVFLANGKILRGPIIQMHDDFLTLHDKTYGPTDIPFQSINAVAPIRTNRTRSKTKTPRTIKKKSR